MEKSTLNKSERSYKEKKVVQDICFQLLLNMCKNIFVYTLQLEITSQSQHQTQVECPLVMLVSHHHLLFLLGLVWLVLVLVLVFVWLLSFRLVLSSLLLQGSGRGDSPCFRSFEPGYNNDVECDYYHSSILPSGTFEHHFHILIWFPMMLTIMMIDG